MKTATKTWVGVGAWTLFVALTYAFPTNVTWSHALLVFVVLVLLPSALDLISERRDQGKVAAAFVWIRKAQLPAGLLLALACAFAPGFVALMFALPWAVVTFTLAWYGLGRVLRDRWSRQPDRLAVDLALMYLAVGGAWVLIERAGLRPLGMEPARVAFGSLLFHVTGLFLPLLGGNVLRQMPESRFGARGLIGAVLTVPALGLGVLLAQPGWTSALEAAAGFGLALSGGVIAILHVRWGLDVKGASVLVRALAGLAGISLFFAMLFAAVYAIRSYVPLMPTLDLTRMQALHGSLMAFGFALCGTTAWRIYSATARS